MTDTARYLPLGALLLMGGLAACAGVLIHARAGGMAAERLGGEGVIAGDVIEALPGALRTPVSAL